MIYWELTRIIAMDVNQLIPRIITHASMRWCTELKICSLSLSQKRNIKMQTGRVLPETIRVRYATSKSQGMPEKKGFQEMSGIQTISEIKQRCYARIRHLCISCQTNRPKPMLWKCWKIGRITGSTITKSCARKSCDVELEFKMNG